MKSIKSCIALILVLTLSFGLTSCDSKEKNNLEKTIVDLETRLKESERLVLNTTTKINSLNSQNANLIKDNKEFTSIIADLKNSLSNSDDSYYKDLYTNLSTSQKNASNSLRLNSSIIVSLNSSMTHTSFDFLPIFNTDVNTYAHYPASFCIVSKDSSLEDKLSRIASELSKSTFYDLPIELIEIKTEDGKKIAYINLRELNSINEKGYYPSPSWASSRFQGSTGGTMTIKNLQYSFLQPSFEGSWIDGVKFLYHKEDIDFQHVSSLSEKFYRAPLLEDTESAIDYFPLKKAELKYSGGYENGGYKYTFNDIRGNKLFCESSDGAISMGWIYEITKNQVKLIYHSGENYDKNKDYFEEPANEDYIVLKGPIKLGTSWKNNNSLSIITGTNIKMSTRAKPVTALEVTTLSEDTVHRRYYGKGVGFIKSETFHQEGCTTFESFSEILHYKVKKEDS